MRESERVREQVSLHGQLSLCARTGDAEAVNSRRRLPAELVTGMAGGV